MRKRITEVVLDDNVKYRLTKHAMDSIIILLRTFHPLEEIRII